MSIILYLGVELKIPLPSPLFEPICKFFTISAPSPLPPMREVLLIISHW